MNSDIRKLIKKAKRKRYIKLTLFVLVAALSLLFLSKGEISVMDKTRTFGVGIPDCLVIIIVVLEFFAYLFISAIDVAGSENLLYNDCDPEKYTAVRLNAFSKRFTTPADFAEVSSKAAFASGDFEACMNHALRIESEKKGMYRLASAFGVCKASFFLGNTENMKIALGRAKAEMDNDKTKLGAKENELLLRQMEMLCLLSCGNIQAALQYAGSVAPCDNRNYSVASCSFYRGLVYRAAGERIKAIHCFMTASEKGGKTFFKAKSDEILRELEKEAEK